MIPTTRRSEHRTLAMETARRENYDSGEDFVLEYGELRFTFNESDFAERCEQAALKLGFVGGRLGEEELEDLVNLAVNGEISTRPRRSAEHVNDCWPELVGPAERSLVHWLRRLVFRGAWLDQRVNEGELGVVFDERTGSFAYVQPADPRSSGTASRSSSRPSPPGAGSPTAADAAPAACRRPPVRARACVIAAAPVLAHEQLRLAACRWRAGRGSGCARSR